MLNLLEACRLTAIDHCHARGLRDAVRAGFLVLAGTIATAPATAAVYDVNGAAVGFGFSDVGGPNATPPDSPVTSSFSFQYDDGGLTGSGSESLTGLSLDSFDATIDSVTYTASDVLASVFFDNGAYTGFQIFKGAPGIIAGTNDIFVSFTGTVPSAFSYASANYTGSIFAASTFEGEATRTPVDVPAPGTMLLLLGAGMVLPGFRRRPARGSRQ